MKAVQLLGRENVQTVNVDKPEPAAGEIVLETHSAFICGTDVRAFQHGLPVVEEHGPITLGHEIAGVVSATGEGVHTYEKGMRVAVDPNYGCGVCDMCVSGNTQLCPDYRALGIHENGGFAPFVRVPAAAVRQGNVVPLPDGVSFVEGALAEPLSCVYNAFERCHSGPGDTVVVFGAGPIGLMHARMHLGAGAAKVIVADIQPGRLEQCKTLEPSVETVQVSALGEAVKEHTGGRGANVCITAAPAKEAQDQALSLAAVNGHVVFFGGLPKSDSRATLDTNLIHYRQLYVTGTTRQSLRQYRRTIELLNNKFMSVEDIVTAQFPLEEGSHAFRHAVDGGGLKIGFEVTA